MIRDDEEGFALFHRLSRDDRRIEREKIRLIVNLADCRQDVSDLRDTRHESAQSLHRLIGKRGDLFDVLNRRMDGFVPSARALVCPSSQGGSLKRIRRNFLDAAIHLSNRCHRRLRPLLNLNRTLGDLADRGAHLIHRRCGGLDNCMKGFGVIRDFIDRAAKLENRGCGFIGKGHEQIDAIPDRSHRLSHVRDERRGLFDRFFLSVGSLNHRADRVFESTG